MEPLKPGTKQATKAQFISSITPEEWDEVTDFCKEHYPEEPPVSVTGVKYDSEKPKMHLLPPRAIEEVAEVLTDGAAKYSEDNWKKVPHLKKRYISASLRHIFSFLKGELKDPETGLSHLAHAACCLLFIIETTEDNG